VKIRTEIAVHITTSREDITDDRMFLAVERRRIAMRRNEEGKIGWILLWALGVPIPILVLLFLLRGCT
jgi:hypothetical protein